MKHLMFVALLILVASVATAQIVPGNFAGAYLFKTYTTFTATSDDTSGFVTFGPDVVLNASEVALVAVATDSVNADVNVIGTNRNLLNAAGARVAVTTYADSLNVGTTVWTTTTPYLKVITLKDGVINRLAGCTDFKVGTVFRATLQGTTAGRTLKWYLYWRK